MRSARLILGLWFAFCAANAAGALIRGPYLQSLSSTGIVVRWRTDSPSDSLIRFGNVPGNLGRGVADLKMTNEHELRVTDLNPDTTYYYSIGTTSETLAAGTNYHFTTAPETARAIRIWVIGDSGTADINAATVRDHYKTFTQGVKTDLWLMLGDNAYGSGTDSEYQAAVFQMYPEMLRQVAVWPTIGNHDAGDNDPPTSQPPYLDIFTLPQNGECGGVASGSELYYSFDYGNIHLVCLDSQSAPHRAQNGAMLTWLEADLAATDKEWIIAYWHHPPYSWGTHDSDNSTTEIEMRERVLPILENHGVDLVLSGHSHVYERSFLLDGHYGYSWDLDATNILAAGGTFSKPAGGMGARRGTVYVVCGLSGAGGSGDFPLHPAMAANSGGYGSMVIDVNSLQLSARFRRSDGEYEDLFSINKSAPPAVGPELHLVRTANGATVTWPTSHPEYTLESLTNLSTTNWQAAPEPTSRQGRRNTVNLSTEQSARFFRLRPQQ